MKKINVDNKVVHKKFGEGIVLEVFGFGSDPKLHIEFDKEGRKTILSSYVKLVKS